MLFHDDLKRVAHKQLLLNERPPARGQSFVHEVEARERHSVGVRVEQFENGVLGSSRRAAVMSSAGAEMVKVNGTESSVVKMSLSTDNLSYQFANLDAEIRVGRFKRTTRSWRHR